MKAQTAVTDRLGERSGGSSCPETGGAPAVARSARTSDEGEDGLALDSSAWRLAAGEGSGGSGACCHLAGRAHSSAPPKVSEQSSSSQTSSPCCVLPPLPLC